MNRYNTQGIVLTRTNFGEADRIVTYLTANHGKLRVMAKAVRKPKSKLAAGVELFTLSDLTLLVGKSDIRTLMSARPASHCGNIVKAGRAQAGFEALKLSNKATEDQPEPAYFNLLKQTLESLNDSQIGEEITILWFNLQLLKLAGHMPDLRNDTSGQKLKAAASYDFHLDDMRFSPKAAKQGSFSANEIKFLRVGFAAAQPAVLQRVAGGDALALNLQPLVQSMLKTFFRI